MRIPLVIQHRHIHLSADDRVRLFGEQPLTVVGKIEHAGQVIYAETLTIEGKIGLIDQVRVLGPDRTHTQVELSESDAFAIGLTTPVRQSGDIVRSASCELVGPFGSLRSVSSVIVPARHLHCSDQVAKELRVKNHDVVTLRHIKREDVVLEHVFVRVHPTYALSLHLTADEAAHDWLQSGDFFTL